MSWRLSSDVTSGNYGDLSVVAKGSVNSSIQNTEEALWTVSVTEGVSGNAPKFTFINKATGLSLSVDASKANEVTGVIPNEISGSVSEWLNTPLTDNGNTVYLCLLCILIQRQTRSFILILMRLASWSLS